MADVTNVQLGACSVMWGIYDLGHTKGGVVFSYEPTYADGTVDKYGETPVEKFLTGEKVTVKVPLAEFTVANMGKAMPVGQWAGAGNARRLFGSASSKKATSYAQQLTLHPLNEGTRRHDIVLYKAFPSSAITINHAVDEQKIIEVTFDALLDETKSDGNYLGMIGDSTA